MKRIPFFVITILLASSLMAQFTKAELVASGLTCSMCSKAVKEALEKVPFVQEVKVNIKSQVYMLVFKENETTNFDALKKAVEDAGFSVASLKVTGNFSAVTVQKDKHIQVDGKSFHFLNGNDQVLNGEKMITIVDRDFVLPKDYKKYSAASKMQCVKTGKAESCCEKDGVSAGARVYHVII